MANVGDVETKMKEAEIPLDKEFQWGKMPEQDLSGQFTRSMMEMRKPKAYELTEPCSLRKKVEMESIGTDIKVQSCPITTHTIKLLRYIRQAQNCLTLLEDRSNSVYNYGPQLPQLPRFEEGQVAALRRSRSSSSGNSLDTEDKSIFSAPDLNSSFRSGKITAKTPPLDEDTCSRILKKSVATVSAHAGFEEASSSALNVLSGVADAFMTSFSKSLRNTLDTEAETGRTAFYDAITQVLHDSGLSGLKDIEEFWQKRIVKRQRMLQNQAEKLSIKLQSMKYPKPGDTTKSVKPEKVQSTFPTTYGKWTPVTGMSSSPFPHGRSLDTMAGPSWATTKLEPQDNTTYTLAGMSQQENFLVKSEYEGLESTEDMFNADKSEDNFGVDSYYNPEEYRPAKKRTRN